MSTYNGEAFLAEAIDSIIAQTNSDWRLIVVDDVSTDRSAEIVVTYQDPRIQLLRLPANLGQSGALNAGLDLVDTRFVTRLDQDDLASPERVSTMLEFLEMHPEVVLAGSWSYFIDDQNRRLGEFTPPTDNQFLRTLLIEHPNRNPIAHSSVVFRADLARQVGGYSTDLRIAMDYALWLQLMQHGSIAVIPQFLCSLRQHASQATAGGSGIIGLREVLTCSEQLGTTLGLTKQARRRWRAGRAELAFEAIGVMIYTNRSCSLMRRNGMYFAWQILRTPLFLTRVPRLTHSAFVRRSKRGTVITVDWPALDQNNV